MHQWSPVRFSPCVFNESPVRPGASGNSAADLVRGLHRAHMARERMVAWQKFRHLVEDPKFVANQFQRPVHSVCPQHIAGSISFNKPNAMWLQNFGDTNVEILEPRIKRMKTPILKTEWALKIHLLPSNGMSTKNPLTPFKRNEHWEPAYPLSPARERPSLNPTYNRKSEMKRGIRIAKANGPNRGSTPPQKFYAPQNDRPTRYVHSTSRARFLSKNRTRWD